jgi:hypothetical protein
MGFLGRPQDAPWRDGVYLTTCYSTFDSDIIESKLRAENIPCIKNYRGASNFMEITLGYDSTQAIEIFVPEQELERAKEAIKSIPIEDDYEEAVEGDEDGEGIDDDSEDKE